VVRSSYPARTASSPGASRTMVRSVWARVRAGRIPYHVGDVVIGEDEFLGRRQGRITTTIGPVVGVTTPTGTFFYDYRQLRQPD
jgi:hypothetical protein